jgi:micrococcal nuclease
MTRLLALLLCFTACGPTDAEDLDCADFDTHEVAQLFYEAHGGPDRDRHHLDADRDGVACEALL